MCTKFCWLTQSKHERKRVFWRRYSQIWVHVIRIRRDGVYYMMIIIKILNLKMYLNRLDFLFLCLSNNNLATIDRSTRPCLVWLLPPWIHSLRWLWNPLVRFKWRHMQYCRAFPSCPSSNSLGRSKTERTPAFWTSHGQRWAVAWPLCPQRHCRSYDLGSQDRMAVKIDHSPKRPKDLRACRNAPRRFFAPYINKPCFEHNTVMQCEFHIITGYDTTEFCFKCSMGIECVFIDAHFKIFWSVILILLGRQ